MGHEYCFLKLNAAFDVVYVGWQRVHGEAVGEGGLCSRFCFVYSELEFSSVR